MANREQRKEEHLKFAAALPDGPLSTWLEHVGIMHNCLPEVNKDSVELSISLGSLTLPKPLILDAITGGAKAVEPVNRQLATIAMETGIAMAVGSQYGAVKNKNALDSYKVIRKENPQGVVFANISALASPDEAQAAVDMLEAQALQIHLNAAQELAMQEGDRFFHGYLSNIEKICHALSVPVMVKETGCGMARDEVKKLAAVGVTLFDVGGAGGTNFPAIETARTKSFDDGLLSWGIPTALSLVETVSVVGAQQGIVAGGGIRSALDCCKALCLGANAVSMSGNILKLLQTQGQEKCCDFINFTLERLREYMVLTGSKRITDLTSVPLYFTHEFYQALLSRGYSVAELARRR